VERRVKLRSSLRTFLLFTLAKGNMIFIIYRKNLRTIFMGKTLFKGFLFFFTNDQKLHFGIFLNLI